MKKKSIFVVALAALMLIAFTACEQAVPTFGGKELVRLGVEKVSDKDYLIGQEFDPSTIKVTAYFADGSSAIADSEKDLIFGYDFKDAGAKTVSISYQGSTGNQKTTSYMVTVYKPTELKIAGTPSVVTYYQDTVDTTADVSKTGVTVTAVYNGTKEMVLAEDEYTLTASVASVDDEVAVTAKFVADDTISKDAEFTVKVVADAVDPSTLAIAPKSDAFVAYSYKTFAWTDWQLTAKTLSGDDATPVDITGTGNTATVSTAGGTVSLTYTNNIADDKNAHYLGGAKISGTFLATGENPYTKTITLDVYNVRVENDIPKTITIEWGSDGAPTELKKGDRIPADVITLDVDWMSEYDYESNDVTAPNVSYTLNPSTVQEDANETQAIWITVPASYGDVEITNNGQLSFTVAANE